MIIRIGYGIQLGHHLQASVSGIICLISFIESVINCDLVIFFEIYLCDFLRAQLVNGSCNYFLCFWWQPPAAITVVLNVRMHCEACAQGLRKRIRKIQGIYFHWHSHFPLILQIHYSFNLMCCYYSRCGVCGNQPSQRPGNCKRCS